MPNESRVKKSLLNAKVNLIFYFLSLALSFFSRKIFLDTLGADFMGLTGTLINLLGFLNLAELGIGTAIGYVLYKPLFEHDKKQINEIISVFGYIYRWIGLIILGAGCVMAGCLPFIFPNTPFNYEVIYFAFFSFLTSSLIGYFANYKQTLLGADQKNYILTICYQSIAIVKISIQIALTYYYQNYYLWIGMELLFGISYSILLNIQIKRVYPWLKADVKTGKTLLKKYPDIIKYSKQIFVHRISKFAQSQTIPFLIYAFVSLKTVAFYGNYSLIIDKITLFTVNLLDSSNAGVGNLIAEGNSKKIQRIFWELLSLRFFFAGIILFALYLLTESFISLWLGPEYILPHNILYLIMISAFIGYTRGTTDQFLYGYGLFSDTWAALAETTINLIVAITGGIIWGLPGILLGNIASLVIIVSIWKPYFLYSKGFKISVIHYWINYMKLLLLISLPAIGCYALLSNIKFAPTTSFLHWIKYALCICGSYSLSSYLLLYLFSQGMRDLTKRIIKKQ